MTPEEMKRKLAILQTIEGAGGDISHQALEDVTPAEPEVSAPPVRQPLTPRPAPTFDIQRIAPTRTAPPRDEELAAAKNSDVGAFNDRATETALRQIVGGITRTAVPDSVTPLGSSEKDLLARRHQTELDTLRQMEAGNNAARTSAYLQTNAQTNARAEQSGVRADKKLALDETEAQRRDARSSAKQVLEAADLERKKAADAAKAKRGAGGKAAPARDENGNLLPSTFKDQLRANGVALRPDEYLIDPKGPGFRDAKQAGDADKLRGNLSKLEAHRADAAKFLAEYHAAGADVKKQDTALGRLGIALGAAASMVRNAENMGDSVQAQQAADQMLSLSHGDPKNLKNFINEGRIDALLEASVGAAHHNVVGQLKHMNVGIREPGAQGGGAATGSVSMKFPDGSVHDVSTDKLELAKRKGAVPNG